MSSAATTAAANRALTASFPLRKDLFFMLVIFFICHSIKKPETSFAFAGLFAFTGRPAGRPVKNSSFD